MSHNSTWHIMPGEQRTTHGNRRLHIGIRVIIATVTIAETSLINNAKTSPWSWNIAFSVWVQNVSISIMTCLSEIGSRYSTVWMSKLHLDGYFSNCYSISCVWLMWWNVATASETKSGSIASDIYKIDAGSKICGLVCQNQLHGSILNIICIIVLKIL